VLDDYLTYGLSFSVANALLRRAGATRVTGVAMGKFGNCAQRFDIQVVGDPCKPLRPSDYRIGSARPMGGTHTDEVQLALLEKFGRTFS